MKSTTNSATVLKTGFLLFAATRMAWVAIATSANAQITLGGNEAEFKRILQSRGFDRIETQKIGISNSRFHACKGNKRYRVKFDWTGNIGTKVIGKCRVQIDQAQITSMLQEKGYNRINIEDRSGKYVAIACREGEKFRVVVNYFGDIRKTRRIGRCQQDATPEDITAKLKQQGYTRIRFLDRSPPSFVAEACLDRNKVEMIINRRGVVVEENPLGRCARAARPTDLIKALEDRGLTRVVITDDKLPRYKAEGCRGSNRVEVAMNRWGEIRDEVRIGSCRSAYDVASIREIMVNGGITNVSVIKSRRGFVAKGCSEGRYREFKLNQYGEVLGQKDLGSCTSPAINVLAETMRKRGMRNLQFFAEGCRDGKKVRITFDDFANRLNREVLGNCDPERVGHN